MIFPLTLTTRFQAAFRITFDNDPTFDRLRNACDDDSVSHSGFRARFKWTRARVLGARGSFGSITSDIWPLNVSFSR